MLAPGASLQRGLELICGSHRMVLSGSTVFLVFQVSNTLLCAMLQIVLLFWSYQTVNYSRFFLFFFFYSWGILQSRIINKQITSFSLFLHPLTLQWSCPPVKKRHELELSQWAELNKCILMSLDLRSPQQWKVQCCRSTRAIKNYIPISRYWYIWPKLKVIYLPSFPPPKKTS